MTINTIIGANGNRTYQVLIRRKGYKTVSKNFPKKALAEKFKTKTLSEMDSHKYDDQSLADKMTFREALAKYIEEVTPAKKGFKAETNRANTLRYHAEFIDMPLARIKPNDISTYHQKRKNSISNITNGKLSGNTIRNEFNLISCVFNEAASEWGMDNLSNPTSKTKRPKKPQSRMRRFYDGEEKLIIEALNKEVTRPWMRPFMEFLWTVGMRCGEVAKIEPSDIDLKKRQIWLQDNKTDYPRYIPIPIAGVEILQSFEWGKKTVFHVKQTTAQSGWLEVKNQMIADGLMDKNDDLHLHDFRHEAVSRHFEKKTVNGENLLNVIQISVITGHKDLNTLNGYTHIKADSVVETMIAGGY